MKAAGGILLGLLLSPSFQAEPLVRDLTHTDALVRERAADRLADLGEGVRPSVEKAHRAAPSPLKERLGAILAEIDLGEKRASLLGRPIRITVPAGERLVSEILAALLEQSNIEVVVPEALLASPVKIEAKDTPFWEFLDRLCRAHGNLRIADKQPERSVALEAGKPPAARPFSVGPFRIWMERLKVERHESFDQKWGRGLLVVAVGWTPLVSPDPVGFDKSRAEVKVQEIVGDDGKPLALDPRLVTDYGGFGTAMAEPLRARQYFFFELPGPKVRKLARIRGTATMTFGPFKKRMEFELKDVDLP